MDEKAYFIDVKRPIPLLIALVDKFKGNSSISLEGKLSLLDVSLFRDVSKDETTILKRNTLYPSADFIVIPLSYNNANRLKSVLHNIGLRNRVWHVHIESEGTLVFGACDNFMYEYTYITSLIDEQFLIDLQQNHIINKYVLDVLSNPSAELIEKQKHLIRKYFQREDHSDN